jgi:hypothetical protein
MDDGKGVYSVSGEIRRARRRWENNIKMNLRDVVFDGANWIRWLRIESSGGLL